MVSTEAQVALTVVIATLVLLVLVGAVVMLVVVSANRRHRHRAELAELHLQRDRELRQAEREATGQALSEVGRELHDNVGQLLTVTQLGLRDHVDPKVLEHPRVAVALEALDQSVEEIRRLGRSLDQDRWQDRTLLTAVEAEATRLERLGMAKVLMQVVHGPVDPDRDTKTMLFRVFQEVVSNALRHSGAGTLTIVVDGPAFTLAVSDNGRGFDPEARSTGNGLRNVQHRCGLIGYLAQLNTSPGKGTTWTFTPNGNT